MNTTDILTNEIETVETIRDETGAITEIVVTAFSAVLCRDVRVTFTATGFTAEVWDDEDGWLFAGSDHVAGDLGEGVDVDALEAVFDAARSTWTAEEEAFAS